MLCRHSNREWLRFGKQRTRFASALVRPLLWPGVFAPFFAPVLGIFPLPPYQTYITYENLHCTGACAAWIILFNSIAGRVSRWCYDASWQHAVL